jgi:hypothetical protein
MRNAATPWMTLSAGERGVSSPGTTPPVRARESRPRDVSRTSVESERCLRMESRGGFPGWDTAMISSPRNAPGRLVVESLAARRAATNRGGAGAGRCLGATADGMDEGSSRMGVLRFSTLRLALRRREVDGTRR